MDLNKIYHGDCLDLMIDIPSKSIDMILCDLPYGTTQCKWDTVIDLKALWLRYERVIKDNGAIVLFGAEPFSSHLRLSNLKIFKYDWIWDKPNGTGFLNAKKQPMRNHEIVSVFYKNQCTYNPQFTEGHARKTAVKRNKNKSPVYGKQSAGSIYDSSIRYPRSIQVFSKDVQHCNMHPTQKPVLLMEYLIKTYTNPGDIVLDNCIGSGTTAIACINTGRNFIGIEKDEKYYNKANRRIQDYIDSRNNN